MGACFSTKTSSSNLNRNKIRVVHLNGYVEDFEYPISVSQITGRPSKHFLSTPIQLLSNGSKPLNPNFQLQPGQIYLLLPYSTLKSDCSPLDFASVVKKLTSIANSTRCLAAAANNSCSASRRILNCSSSSAPKKPWKPILDTIREKSFNRRSESEVFQEMQMEMENEFKESSLTAFLNS